MKIGAIIGAAGLFASTLGVLGVVNITLLGGLGMIVGVIVLFAGRAKKKREAAKTALHPAPGEAGSQPLPNATRNATPDDGAPRRVPAGARAPSLEAAILRAAEANGGTITPTVIAADGEYSLEACEAHLKTLVDKGFAELRWRDAGGVFYEFPDLAAPAAADATEAPATPPVGPPQPDPPAADEPPRSKPDAVAASAPRERPRLRLRRSVHSAGRRTIRPARAARPPRATREPRWIPAGESVIVAGREIGGMVYVGRGPVVDGEPDNAFIDPARRVAKEGDDLDAEGMSYWPNYSSIHPRSRATYLAWLAGGRSDPIHVGYVFLYFYGLERRFFVHDDLDERAAIVAEVERLRSIYGSDRAVRSYLGALLEAAPVVMEDAKEWAPVFERSGHELPIPVRLAVGCMLRDSEPIPARWMLSWLMTHPERRLRTPAVRAFPEFKALFELRFQERFPGGLKVTAPRRTLSLRYQAASVNFEMKITPGIEGGGIPDIADLAKPVARVWPIAGLDARHRGLTEELLRQPSWTPQEFEKLARRFRLMPAGALKTINEWASERYDAGLIDDDGNLSVNRDLLHAPAA